MNAEGEGLGLLISTVLNMIEKVRKIGRCRHGYNEREKRVSFEL